LLTNEQLESEYNARGRVPDHPAYFARWERDSDFVRATLPCTLDVPYGPEARHRMDLFPAAHARGTLVFIHGGYWRSLDKSLFSWLAAAWVAAGVSVVVPNYRRSSRRTRCSRSALRTALPPNAWWWRATPRGGT
jgi:arylformamidase